MTDEELMQRLARGLQWTDDGWPVSGTSDDMQAAAAAIAALEAERDALVKERDDAVIKRAAWELEAKTQKARAERLEAALNDLGLEMLRSDETQAFMQSRITTYREALSFYAKWGVENPRHDDLVRDDGGDIARAALSATTEEGK